MRWDVWSDRMQRAMVPWCHGATPYDEGPAGVLTLGTAVQLNKPNLYATGMNPHLRALPQVMERASAFLGPEEGRSQKHG